jgi:hypothetical protein
MPGPRASPGLRRGSCSDCPPAPHLGAAPAQTANPSSDAPELPIPPPESTPAFTPRRTSFCFITAFGRRRRTRSCRRATAGLPRRRRRQRPVRARRLRRRLARRRHALHKLHQLLTPARNTQQTRKVSRNERGKAQLHTPVVLMPPARLRRSSPRPCPLHSPLLHTFAASPPAPWPPPVRQPAPRPRLPTPAGRAAPSAPWVWQHKDVVAQDTMQGQETAGGAFFRDFPPGHTACSLEAAAGPFERAHLCGVSAAASRLMDCSSSSAVAKRPARSARPALAMVCHDERDA